MKTYLQRNEDVVRNWYIVDATDQTLGKLAVRIARVLMGRHVPTWTPSTDGGQFVVVTNASKVSVTGKKREDKVYRRHTGYVGGLVEESFGEVQQKNPARIVEFAVRRMLPKTRQGRAMFRRLKVYGGAEHSHDAQAPLQLPV